MTKIRCEITRMKRHIKATPISAEEYPNNEMSKTNRRQKDDKLNELIVHFTQIHNLKCFNEMEVKGKDTVLRTIHSLKHMTVEHTEAIRQNSSIATDKQEHENRCIIKKIILRQNCDVIVGKWRDFAILRT